MPDQRFGVAYGKLAVHYFACGLQLQPLVEGEQRARVPHLDQARILARRVDALILDTYDPESGKGGATGKTHDWQISRAIVDAVAVPVILAGGLTPDNVEAAIAQVQPWGVDVHTGIEDPDGSRNLEKIRSFIRRSKGGAA